MSHTPSFPDTDTRKNPNPIADADVLMDSHEDSRDTPDEFPEENVEQEDTLNTEERHEDNVPESSEESKDLLYIEVDQAAESEESNDVRELRKRYRELKKENKQLKESVLTKQPDVVVEMPTLEECDYDLSVYNEKYKVYYEAQKTHQEALTRKQAEEQKIKQNFEAKVQAYHAAKQKLNIKDFDDAEAIVGDVLSEQQIAIILHGSRDPAGTIYALAKNKMLAQDLAKKDNIAFAFEVSKLDDKIKIVKKEPNTPPDTPQASTTAPRTDREQGQYYKNQVAAALKVNGGVYNLLKKHPELRGKIENYM